MTSAPVTVKVKVHSDRASAEFKEARREVNRIKRDVIIRSGEKAFMDPARAVVPTPIKSQLVVRATGQLGYLSTKGKKINNSIFELFNFGGYRRFVIRPKAKRAVTVNGTPRAKVRALFHWKGTRRVSTLVEGRLDNYADLLKREVMEAFKEFNVD